MNWFKIAAVTAGVLISFLIVSSIVGFLVKAAIIAAVVAAVVFGIKAAYSSRQVTRRGPVREVRAPRSGGPPRGQQKPDAEDELARLRREMRDSQ
jgi:hypothetical protein